MYNEEIFLIIRSHFSHVRCVVLNPSALSVVCIKFVHRTQAIKIFGNVSMPLVTSTDPLLQVTYKLQVLIIELELEASLQYDRAEIL